MKNIQKKQSTDTLREADKQSSDSAELVKKSEIKDTPFLVVEIDGKAFGTFGIYRITEEYKTKEEAEEVLRPVTWNRIVQIVSIINEMLNGKKQ